MTAIYKYRVTPECRLQIPFSGKILCAQVQHGDPHIWVQVDPNHETEERRFFCFPTGKDFDVDGLIYIGTFQVDNGLVFHIYEQVIFDRSK